ncbi:MAG: hypothetical protein ACYTG0_23580 [Planctomycetota bacterium]|jgi:hypothetical protein
MADCLEKWRSAFSEYIQQPVVAEGIKHAALAQDLSTWTSSLTAAVVRSCVSIGWEAAGKWNRSRRLPQPGQEYLNIDVTAFPSAEDSRAVWPLPLAVFELENHRTDKRVAYSLWKVLCIRAMLRVVIAYRPDWDQSRQLVANLKEGVIDGLTPEERMSLGGHAYCLGRR